MPEQTVAARQEGTSGGAPPDPSGDRRAAAVSNRLLDRTREAIRGVGRQLAARQANLDRLAGKP